MRNKKGRGGLEVGIGTRRRPKRRGLWRGKHVEGGKGRGWGDRKRRLDDQEIFDIYYIMVYIGTKIIM
jgi:hypothetical protein